MPAKTPSPISDIARDVHARRQMGVVADDAIMVDGAGGVENAIASDLRVGIDDHVGEHDAALADHDAARERRARMQGGGKLCAGAGELREDFPAHRIVANSQDQRIDRMILPAGDRAAYRQTENCVLPKRGIIVEKTDDLIAARCEDDVGDDLGVPPGANDGNTHRFPGSFDPLQSSIREPRAMTNKTDGDIANAWICKR